MRKVRAGGGWPAIWYTFKKARQAGGLLALWKAMRTKNVCKTCAVGMGGQAGGMVNEAGHFPEVCKKSLQAMVADMQGAVRPEFFETYSLAQLQAFTPRQLEHCGRITQPLLHRRGEDYYRPISWDGALALVAEHLKRIAPRESFWYFSGRSSNEAGFLLQLFARIYGTNNVNNCSYYCHQASGVGLSSVLGSGAGTVRLEDLERADLVFLIGANPASNHPRLMRSLMTVRRRGGRVIVVNPIVETGLVNFKVPSDAWSLLFGTRIASRYVQPHIGGDLALFLGLAKRTNELGAVDQPFADNHCEGWPDLAAHLDALSWQDLEQRSGVSRREMDEVAQEYAAGRNVVFAWTMGITHHLHGVQNVRSIANLALMRGMVGKPHAGLMPIRGHSNVQGLGTVGVTPKLKDAVFARLEQEFGVKLPTEPGLDTMACVEAAALGKLKVGVLLGGNLYGSNPDSRFVREALGRLDLVVMLNTTLNTGHAHGLAAQTLILPVLARDEEPQVTTQESMFSYVRYSDGGPRRHEGPRSEIEIIADLARRVVGDSAAINWSELEVTRNLRAAISRIVPDLASYKESEESRREFHIPGRAFHGPSFATTNGRAKLHAVALPASVEADRLRLMTIRSEGQFNTVVYEEEDLYRGIDRRDVVLVHPDDLVKLRVGDGDLVTVISDIGQLSRVSARSFPQIKPGNVAMYYPEANALVPRDVDPLSRTPAFKHVLVTISPALGAVAAMAADAESTWGPSDPTAAESSTSRASMKAC